MHLVTHSNCLLDGEKFMKNQNFHLKFRYYNIQLYKGIAGTVIGGIATMWGETNDDNSHFTKLLVRLNVAAERFWNPDQKK